MWSRKSRYTGLGIAARLVLIGVIVALATSIIVAQEDTDCDLDSAEEFRDRALDYSDAGEYERAIADLTCALALDPDNPTYYNDRGIAYDDIGDYDSAFADYQRALEIDPSYHYAYNNRGNVYYYWGDYERALADYNHAIEVYTTSPYIPYYNRANLYQEQGEYELALADLDQVLELNSSYHRAYLSRALVYLSLGDDRAHEDFAEWIRRIQTDEIVFTLGEMAQVMPYTMTEGRVYRFEFEATAGQVLNVLAEAGGDDEVDPLLVLLDEEEFAIMSDDDSGVNLDAVIADFIIPLDGTYALLLSHAGGGSEGNINLTIDVGGEILATFAVYNLSVKDIAEVYAGEGDRLNLRAGPGLEFEIMDRLERGLLVTLLEGPHKADGYAWWRIRTQNGIVGWAVERAEGVQTLQPALLVGEEAIVTSGEDLLNVREEPGVASSLLFQLSNEEVVTLLEMPQFADGYRWWRIRTEDGRDGWVVDRVEGERTLIPARERQ